MGLKTNPGNSTLTLAQSRTKNIEDLIKQADIVISDMAPYASGHKSTDQTRSLLLAELALDAAISL